LYPFGVTTFSQFATGGKVVADCVEVALREIFDLLLFNPEVTVFYPYRISSYAS
jgi:hypothetical protein